MTYTNLGNTPHRQSYSRFWLLASSLSSCWKDRAGLCSSRISASGNSTISFFASFPRFLLTRSGRKLPSAACTGRRIRSASAPSYCTENSFACVHSVAFFPAHCSSNVFAGLGSQAVSVAPLHARQAGSRGVGFASRLLGLEVRP